MAEHIPGEFQEPRSAIDYTREGPRRRLLMTPHLAAIGGLLAFFTVVLMVVVLPTETYHPPASTNWLPLSNLALRGRAVYLSNGCVYCHSGFSRPQDVAVGLYYLYPRVSEPGDYAGNDSPNILGSERTGPDLSQEGGNHPDDWQRAHYDDPRNTTPISIMPRFNFFSDSQLKDMIAFNQSQGGKEATLRNSAILVGKALWNGGVEGTLKDLANVFPTEVSQAQSAGTYHADGTIDDTTKWGLSWGDVWAVNTHLRSYWVTRNPLPPTEDNLVIGKQIYLTRCSGCHGPTGDGNGPGARFMAPKPADFIHVDDQMTAPDASDGQFYYRVLTGGKGTDMENFGTRLSVEDTWRVVLFLKTIAKGGLKQTLPTTDMFIKWEPQQGLLNYIKDHPVSDPNAGYDPTAGPFEQAARWIAPGLAPQDTVYIAGKLPVNLATIAKMVEERYRQFVQQDYQDALGRGEPMPPRSEIFSTEGVQWHAP